MRRAALRSVQRVDYTLHEARARCAMPRNAVSRSASQNTDARVTQSNELMRHVGCPQRGALPLSFSPLSFSLSRIAATAINDSAIAYIAYARRRRLKQCFKRAAQFERAQQ